MTGYLIAAANLERFHRLVGRRGIAVLTGCLYVVSAALMTTKPRYALALVAYFCFGLGSGCADAGLCAWAASVSRANYIQGLIHGSFSTGCVIGPVIVAYLDRAQRDWSIFFIISVRLTQGDG